MPDIETIELIRHSKDLRDTWQGKVMEHARGRVMLAVASMLAHAYDEAMAVLFRVVKPACWDVERQSLRAPFLCSIAKINKEGRIVADAILFDGAVRVRDKVIFASTRDFQNELRKLADIARLSDVEREQFFICAKKWVGSDQRLDPTMDPKDPDAKRLVVH